MSIKVSVHGKNCVGCLREGKPIMISLDGKASEGEPQQPPAPALKPRHMPRGWHGAGWPTPERCCADRAAGFAPLSLWERVGVRASGAGTGTLLVLYEAVVKRCSGACAASADSYQLNSDQGSALPHAHRPQARATATSSQRVV